MPRRPITKRTLIPLLIAGMASLTLGLAPFRPRPHVIEKLELLFRGELTSAIDVVDLLVHGLPWLILLVLLARLFTRAKNNTNQPS